MLLRTFCPCLHCLIVFVSRSKHHWASSFLNLFLSFWFLNMGCSSSSAQTVDQEKRPGTKPEETNGDTLGKYRSAWLEFVTETQDCFHVWRGKVLEFNLLKAVSAAQVHSGTLCAFCSSLPRSKHPTQATILVKILSALMTSQQREPCEWRNHLRHLLMRWSRTRRFFWLQCGRVKLSVKWRGPPVRTSFSAAWTKRPGSDHHKVVHHRNTSHLSVTEH